MAVTDVGHGSQTATVTTEHTLFDSSAAGTYTVSVDTVNMAANDVLELRAYEMTLTGGTRRVVYVGTFYGAQITDDIEKVSLPIATALTDSGAVRFTLKQTFGTGRVFPWVALSY